MAKKTARNKPHTTKPSSKESSSTPRVAALAAQNNQPRQRAKPAEVAAIASDMPQSPAAGPPFFGSHLSIAGSMVNALHEAAKLGMSTVQVFTKNQQQWAPTLLDAGVAREWCSTLKAWGWDVGGATGRGRVVSHASYLINLASPNDDLWEKSIALMRVEIERCEMLNIAFLVHHPGAFTTSTRDEGVVRIAKAYARLHKDLPGYGTCLCLEGTAGSGSNLGATFEDLRDLRTHILSHTARPQVLGFCLDTCHLHAAGHDMSTKQAARATLARFDSMCGLSNVRVWHLNDSKGGIGSHLDRHDHIGHGCVGGNGSMPPPKGSAIVSKEPTTQSLANSGFAAVLARFGTSPVPLILETPKEDPKEAKQIPVAKLSDSVNLSRLRGILASLADEAASCCEQSRLGTKG